MTVEIWLAFLISVIVLFLIPGPVMILIISKSITDGKKSVFPLVSGVLLGAFVSMSLSLVGLGAVLAASATLFLVLKWLGVCYLIYLGIKTWRQSPEISIEKKRNAGSSKNIFGSAFFVTALNPKDIMFFVAFFPQFINPVSEPLPQILMLMATFLIIDMLSIILFAVFSHAMRSKINSVHTQRKINRVGGGALIGAGLITASMQRA
jgi:threonine/homoserine/homoserine lactone efflux protein